MTGKTRLRRSAQMAAYGVILLLLTLVLGAVSMPWWLPFGVRWLASHQGVEIGRYERLSYSRFALVDVVWQDARSQTEARVQRVEAPMPLAWLWQRAWADGGRFAISDVTVTVGSDEEQLVEKEESGDSSLPQTLDDTLGMLNMANPWLAGIVVERVTVNVADEALHVEKVSWDGASEQLLVTLGQPFEGGHFLLKREGRNALYLEAETRWGGESVRFTGKLENEKKTAAHFAGALRWLGNRAEMKATWGEAGWLPQRAEVWVKEGRLPAALLGPLPTSGYEEPRWNLQAGWQDGKYEVQLSAKVTHHDVQTYPPLDMEVSLTGDQEGLSVERFQVEAEWLQAQLADPVTVVFAEWPQLPDINWTLEADFDRQGLIPLTGKLSSTLVAENRQDAFPLVTFSLAGRDMVAAGIDVPILKANAQLDWPMLTIGKGEVSTAGGSIVEFAAVADLETETLLESKLHVKLRKDIVEQLSGETIDFEEVLVDAEATGPWQSPEHRGSAQMHGLKLGERALDGDVSWQGEGLALSRLDVAGDSEGIRLSLAGTAYLREQSYQVGIESALIAVADGSQLESMIPFYIRGDTRTGEVSMTRMLLQGPEDETVEMEGSVAWPQSGKVKLSGRNFVSAWLEFVVSERLPFPVTLLALELDAQWDEGPMTFAVTVSAQGEPPNQEAVHLNGAVVSEGETLVARDFELREGEEILARAHGRFPISVWPNDENIIAIDAEAPASFYLMAQPGAAAFWRWMEAYTGINVDSPSMSIELEGSLAEPVGSLRAGFSRLDFSESDGWGHLPKLAPAELRAKFSPEEIEVTAFELGIEGYPLTATARVPMTQDSWVALVMDGVLPRLDEASARLAFQEVPLAAFDDLLPDVMRPRGQVSLTAEIGTGMQWRGDLSIRGVETMPLLPLGSVTDISVDFTLEGETLTVKGGRALIGGREVRVAGSIGVDEPWKPKFDLKIDGENIPFVRSPGLIIRGSPDVTLRTDERGVTWLAGDVVLNESFFTVDLAALGQSNPSDPQGRFPYFSIQDDPLSHWRLNLTVSGNDFMRVRTPVFEGRVSADLKLKGTLSEPFAFGEATLARGVVMFPFANFRVQQGRFMITEDNPYRPVIDMTATSRAYGYDIIMRLEGTLDSPTITFTSTPGLEQSDILLMVTAGRMPTGDDRSTQSRLAGLGLFVGNSILIDMGLMDPLDDRLQVYVGEDVTVTGNDTIRVVYRIDDTWAIVGQYDRFDAYTLDLKWTIYEK